MEGGGAWRLLNGSMNRQQRGRNIFLLQPRVHLVALVVGILVGVALNVSGSVGDVLATINPTATAGLVKTHLVRASVFGRVCQSVNCRCFHGCLPRKKWGTVTHVGNHHQRPPSCATVVPVVPGGPQLIIFSLISATSTFLALASSSRNFW